MCFRTACAPPSRWHLILPGEQGKVPKGRGCFQGTRGGRSPPGFCPMRPACPQVSGERTTSPYAVPRPQDSVRGPRPPEVPATSRATSSGGLLPRCHRIAWGLLLLPEVYEPPPWLISRDRLLTCSPHSGMFNSRRSQTGWYVLQPPPRHKPFMLEVGCRNSVLLRGGEWG